MLRILDTGLDRLDQRVAEALVMARHQALERRYGGEQGQRRVLAALFDFRFRMAAATLLAVMAITAVSWWSSQRSGVEQTGQLDIQLLTGELPPSVYLDKEFPAWRGSPGLCRF